MGRNILVVEDDRNISDLIQMYLVKEGFDVRIAGDGGKAIEEFQKEVPDLILLDIMLPGADGFSVMEQVRHKETPVIFLTALQDVSDKVKGLRLGAEDYIVKPFEIAELLARVEVVLRRYGRSEDLIQMDGLRIDVRSMRVERNGIEIALTPKEYELLLLFTRNPGMALYRETIYERVWGGELEFGSKTVDLHVQRLRKKVGWEKKLVAVSKVGYRLEEGR